jgi:polysaccharide deacetylase family protein (PEP-CTERM system associated)
MKILTFDIEEWFHILDVDATRTEDRWRGFETRIHANVDRILRLLASKQQRATFFCLGWVARTHPDIIRRIDEQGHEIASHTSSHQLVYEQTPAAFKQDVADSLQAIEDCVGKKVSMFRAPGFSVGAATPWAFEVLAECGITIDCSVFPARHGHGGFPGFGQARPALVSVRGITLKEFPVNVISVLGKPFVFSGGGYFRLCPYPLLHRLFAKANYCMTYFHPRDFDADQPVLPRLPLHRKFKSYYGLRGAFAKFERLLNDFTFTDLGTAASLVEWDKAPVVTL